MGVDSPEVIKGVSFFTAFFIISYLHIVIGELAPKSWAIRKPELLSLWTAVTLYLRLLVDPLPRGCRLGDNRHAFIGGLRLWDEPLPGPSLVPRSRGRPRGQGVCLVPGHPHHRPPGQPGTVRPLDEEHLADTGRIEAAPEAHGALAVLVEWQNGRATGRPGTGTRPTSCPEGNRL